MSQKRPNHLQLVPEQNEQDLSAQTLQSNQPMSISDWPITTTRDTHPLQLGAANESGRLQMGWVEKAYLQDEVQPYLT